MDEGGYLKDVPCDLVVLEEWVLGRTMGHGSGEIRSSGCAADNESFLKRSTEFYAIFDGLPRQ
jgi:hypothetical protein